MTTTATTPAVRSYRNYGHSTLRRILISRESAVIAALLVVVLFANLSVRSFSQPITLYYLLLDVLPILLIALPMTLIIVTGEIDLSVASTMGLASVTVGVLHQAGWPIEWAALVAIVIGAIAGAINGFLVTVVGLPSLAVTIGTLALYRGLAVGLLGTTAVTDFTEGWKDFAKSRLGATAFPTVILIFLALAIVFAIMLHFTPFGRGVFAIGLSSEAAHFSGVHVERTKFILFVLAGAVSALAGIFYTLRFGTARGDNAIGLELSVIAAVLLGGVSIFGGRGALHGVIAGVLLIGTVSSALRLASITSDVINIITGVLLVLSVVSTSFLDWLRLKRTRPGKKTGAAAATKG